jgi:hypothetical protein
MPVATGVTNSHTAGVRACRAGPEPARLAGFADPLMVEVLDCLLQQP